MYIYVDVVKNWVCRGNCCKRVNREYPKPIINWDGGDEARKCIVILCHRITIHTFRRHNWGEPCHGSSIRWASFCLGIRLFPTWDRIGRGRWRTWIMVYGDQCYIHYGVWRSVCYFDSTTRTQNSVAPIQSCQLVVASHESTSHKGIYIKGCWRLPTNCLIILDTEVGCLWCPESECCPESVWNNASHWTWDDYECISRTSGILGCVSLWFSIWFSCVVTCSVHEVLNFRTSARDGFFHQLYTWAYFSLYGWSYFRFK